MKKINWCFNIAIVLGSLSLVACGGGGESSSAPGAATPPNVTSITPANGSTGVLTNTTLSVTFSVDMDTATINNSNFTLSGANPVSGSIAYDAATRTATFTPDVPLKPGTDYTASLTTSVTDSSGNALSAVFQGQFSTETFIRRVSVDSSETEANGSSVQPKVSSDGRYVVFQSFANNLVSGDTNNKGDIFIRDTKTGDTTRVSVSTAGVEADNDSSEPAISADGRYVVFQSDATNLIGAGNDTNNRTDIFLHDTQTKSTTRVSVSDSETQADFSSTLPDVSADGRYIVFKSSATNLIGAGNDTNAVTDIFVRDTQLETTIRVSVDSNEVQANGQSGVPRISDNGRYVAFISRATNLIGAGNDSNGSQDVFVRDMQAGTTARVSVSNSDAASNGDSYAPGISADGRYVAFYSSATNLIGVGSDNNSVNDIFVRDTKLGGTTRVSVSNSGSEVNGGSYEPRISADGRYIVFQSDASNLIASDTNGAADVFVRDTQASTTIRVNVDKSGSVGTAFGFGTVSIGISADGRYIVFNSNATNLAPEGDSNGAYDVFRVLNTTP